MLLEQGLQHRKLSFCQQWARWFVSDQDATLHVNELTFTSGCHFNQQTRSILTIWTQFGDMVLEPKANILKKTSGEFSAVFAATFEYSHSNIKIKRETLGE